jgi:hypothetical protein
VSYFTETRQSTLEQQGHGQYYKIKHLVHVCELTHQRSWACGPGDKNQQVVKEDAGQTAIVTVRALWNITGPSQTEPPVPFLSRLLCVTFVLC